MNHVYRSIWNEQLGTYVAVAEIATSRGKKASSSAGRSRCFAVTTLATSLCLGWGGVAMADPTGGVVTAGSASITQTTGKTTIVQDSQNAVINWQSFGIGAGQSVQFVQPGASSVTLNRVVGSDPSSILGSLSANGKVFLVNPNGILFGRGASVSVGGLVASTLDIGDADFMAGRYKFSGTSTAAIGNEGRIDAAGGYVALLGANVSNQGVITARMGSVALAGGQAMTLDVAGDGLLNVSVDKGAVKALVANGGLIQADGGQVLMTAQAAGSLLQTAVNNTGVVQAQAIDTHAGTIRLLGDMQSGTVNVGGTLDASAPAGGHGGFVETSAAHVKVSDDARITTASANGLTGSWLIDPTDYNVAASGGDQTGAFFTNALKSNNVQIQSSSGASGTQGNINVNDTISWSANKLTLTAQNNININKSLYGTGTASLALQYGQQAVAAGNGSGYNLASSVTVDLPTGPNFSTRLGSNGTTTNYQVINNLGSLGSTNGTDLQGIQGNLGGNYVLGSNIDARATSAWDSGKGFVPIGNAASPFTGTLNGLGHEIVGLTINRPEIDVGLFGDVGAGGLVRNLGLSSLSVTGSQANYSGSYGGVGALAGNNSGTIRNVTSSGAVTGSGYVNLGGLVGRNAGTIANSRTDGTVNAPDYAYAGGLVGQNDGGATVSFSSSGAGVTTATGGTGGLVANNDGTISNSYATGAVVAGGNYAGGLAAFSSGVITNSHASGNVTGTVGVGGLLGYLGNGTVDNSYATGNVQASYSNAGGLAALSYGTISNSYATGNVQGTSTVGGVVGYNVSTPSKLINVYFSGAIQASGGSVGALVGDNNGGSVTNGYFNSSLNSMGAVGLTHNGGTSNGMGLSTAQMTRASSFAGFNFTTTAGATGNNWVLVDTDGTLNNAGNVNGGTLPMLASEWSATVNSAHQLQLMTMNKTASYTLGSSFSAAGTASSALDVWGSTGFIPVGSAGSAFTGQLDGTGHIISGLNVAKSGVAGVGLFGVVGSGGVIANVGLSGGAVVGGDGSGALVGTNGGTVSDSFATTAVTGGNNVGGLVGTNTGTVNDSYASGAVAGTSGVGGLVGGNAGTVATSYANGSVSGTGGGLVGSGAGTVTGSFWDTSASGKTTSAGGTGLSTAQLKTLSNYSGANWDLGQTWVVYDGYSAPSLRSFMKPIVVSVSYSTKVYDGNVYSGGANTVSYSNVVDSAVLLGTPVYAGSTSGAVNAGTYAVSASGLYSANGQAGYSITYVAGGLVVTPKSVTLSGAAVANKVYDGTTAAAVSGTLNGVLSADQANVSATVSGTFASKNAGNAIGVTTSGTLGGSAGSNYALVPVSGLSANITQATITGITGITAANKVYDGTTAASLGTGGASFTGKISGDTLTVASGSGSFVDKNAANGKTVNVTGLTLGGADAGNYTLGSSTATSVANISQATITAVTGITAANKVYDGTTAASLNTGGASFTGKVGGDTLTVASGSGSFADKNAANGKTVNVTGLTLGGADAANYTLGSTTVTSTADITQATITAVTGIAAANKVYDGTTAASLGTGGASFTGKISGDTLTVASGSGSFVDKNAANGKTVNVTGLTLGGADAGNYTLGSSTATSVANITQATITAVTGITAANKVYDGTTAASLNTGGASFTGKVGGDTLTVASGSGSFADKNAANGKTVNVTGLTLGGADAGNYTLGSTTATSTANITQATITGITGIAAANKVYDGTTAASLGTGGASFTGKIGGDTLTVASGSGSFVDKNAANGKTVNVTGLTLGGADAGNYTLGSSTATSVANITQATITAVTGITAANKVYDGTTAASLGTGSASFTGKIGGDTLTVASGSGSFADKNAANGKTVNVTGLTLGGADAGNYTLGSTTATSTANITQATITGITGIAAANKVYDGTTAASLSTGSASFTGKIGGDTLTVASGSGSFGDKNAANGKTVSISGLTLGGVDAANYTLGSTTATSVANITQATITGITGITAANKVYDGSTTASLNTGSASFTGKVGGDTLTVATGSGSFVDKNAGVGKTVNVGGITLGGADAGNYTLGSSTATSVANISQATITAVTGITAANKVYDGTTAASLSTGSASFTGKIGGDTLTVASGSGSFGDKNAANGKTVSISGLTLGGVDAANYTLGSTTATSVANITQATITGITGITAANKVYDGSTTASLNTGSASFTGKVGGDTLTVATGSGSFVDKNAGVGKTVNVGGITLGGADAGNYTLGSSTATSVANISQATITAVTGITAANKVYDGTTAASLSTGSASFTGKFGGDTLTVGSGSGSFGDKNAANGKTVSISGLTLGGVDAANYTLGSTTATSVANITQATITGITGITAANKVYDGSTTASLNTGSASFTGKVGGDTLTVASGSGSFVDKNAANGKTVNVTGLTLGGADAGNYTLGSSTATSVANITQATITAVTGITAANKVYDGTTAASLNTGGASFTGKVGGDTLTVASGSGSFADKNAANGKTVNVTGLTLGGADAANYTLGSTTVTSTADITQATITAVTGIAAANKVYDGTTAASLNTGSASFTGKINGDTLTVASGSGSFADKNAANGKTVNVTGLTLGGADAGNYTLGSSTATSSADITQATLTGITGITASNKVYDGTTTASLGTGGASFTGKVGGDTLTVATASGSFVDKNAGVGKTVNVGGITLGGADAANYTLGSTTVTSTADITQATLTAVTGITAANKVYDGTTAASLNSGNAAFTGIIVGDTLTVAAASGSFGDKNAANGKTVAVGGISLGGADAGNYHLADTTATTSANISQATIAGVGGITVANKVYDGSTAASLNTAGASFIGVVSGDSLVVASASGNFVDKNAGVGKTVSVGGITLGGADAANYTLGNTTATGTADITQATITAVTGITAANKVYDGTTTASLNSGNATFNGMIVGDTLTVAAASGSFSDKNAGTGKTVTVGGLGLGGADAGNYHLAGTTTTTSADISQATIAGVAGITADNKVYDGTTAASLNTTGAAFSGMVAGDHLSVAAANGSFSDKNAGNGKAVAVVGITLGGADAGNYTLVGTTASSTANITQATITGVTGITADNKVYDGSTTASLNTGHAAFTGMIVGDTLTVATASGRFSDKNAGNGKTVTVGGLSLGGADAGNYVLAGTTTSPTADITPKALTITADNASRNAGLANPAFSATYDGLVPNETASVLQGTLVLATTAPTTSTAGTYPISASGQTSSNYAIRFVDGQLVVLATSTASITPQAAAALASEVVNTVPTRGDVLVQADALALGDAAAQKRSSDLPYTPKIGNAEVASLAGLNLSIRDFGVNLPSGSNAAPQGPASKASGKTK